MSKSDRISKEGRRIIRARDEALAELIERYELKEKSTRDFGVALLDLLEHVRRLPRDRLLDMLGMPDYFEECDIGECLFYVNGCRV